MRRMRTTSEFRCEHKMPFVLEGDGGGWRQVKGGEGIGRRSCTSDKFIIVYKRLLVLNYLGMDMYACVCSVF